MAYRDLYLTATGCSQIRRIETEASYGQITSTAVVECDSTTLAMGDSVTIDAGYTSNHATLFGGFVKRIDYVRPDNVIRVTCNDTLVKAVDFFIASDDPEKPFQRNNISTPNLVGDLLQLASINPIDYDLHDPGFTWGTNPDGARFNLQTVADAVQFIASIVGYTIYTGTDGIVRFRARKPYVEGGDTPTVTFTTGAAGNIIDIAYSASIDKTRNVVKVYGKTPLTARASAANPYLIVDQTVVIAHELLDEQSLCDGTASINLTLLNRLAETYEMTVEGDPAIQARGIGSITESFTGASNRSVFLYRVAHQLGIEGYTCTITATP